MRKNAPPLLLEREFGRTLRSLRERQGLSQEQFADLCHIHRTYVSQLERGLKSPTLRLLWTICDSVAIKPSDYIGEVEQAIAKADQ